jgi:hypothetical protein
VSDEPELITPELAEQIRARLTWTDLQEDVEILAAFLIQMIGVPERGSRAARLLYALGEALYTSPGLQPR